MRTLFFTFGIVLLSYTYSYSQQNLNSANAANVITTTEEEYNYITVGYPQAVAQGYDVKQGYTTKDLGRWGYQGQDVTFKAFYRDGVSLPIAILATYTYTRGGVSTPPEYYCIPTLNAWNLWQRTIQQVTSESLAGAKYEAFTYALMKLASANITTH